MDNRFSINNSNPTTLTEWHSGYVLLGDDVVQHFGVFLQISEEIVLGEILVEFVEIFGKIGVSLENRGFQ